MAILTISRQFGAGGKTLGEMIARKLGYSFYDDEILQIISHKVNVSVDWVRATEDEVGGLVPKIIRGIIPRGFLERVRDSAQGYIDEDIYLEALKAVFHELAGKDNAVIVGRGGQYFLQDDPKAFHIMLIADLEHRLNFMTTRYDLTPKQAAQAISSVQKLRVNLYNRIGRQDYEQPELYHLVINTRKVSLENTCDLVVDALGRM